MPMSVTAPLATDQYQELIRLFYMLSVVFSYIFRIYLEKEKEWEACGTWFFYSRRAIESRPSHITLPTSDGTNRP